MLTRDQILAANDLRREPVEVPEWGGTVYVRALTGAEWAQIAPNLDTLRGLDLVIMATVDEDGAQLFTKEDAEALEGKHFYALERIAQAVLRVNAMTAEAITEGKDD